MEPLRTFWNWFESHANSFYQIEEKNAHQLLEMLLTRLHDIHPDLTFELGGVSKNNKRELIISAGGVKSAFPYVIKLMELSPQLDDWDFKAFRQRKPDFCEVNFGDFNLNAHDVYFDYELEEKLIEIKLFIKGYNEEPVFAHAIFIILDHLLGEFDLETKVGTITMYSVESKTSTSLPLLDLSMIVDEYFKKR